MATKKKVAKKVTKKAVKKTAKKATAKKSVRKPVAPKSSVPQRLEISVVSQPVVPTESELALPIRSDDGKQLAIPKTWLGEKQLMFMLQQTPKNQIYRRKGRGGKEFDYVTGSYITKALNYVFGWNWDFIVKEHGKEGDHVWVLGQLTVHSPDGKQSITKTQFGRSDVKKLTSGAGNVDYGNDLKSASTDALKKCASMLGFASDVYGKTEYKSEAGQAPAPDPAHEYSQQAPAAPEDMPVDLICNGVTKSGCGNDISKQEYDYSLKVFGKPLCRDCQGRAKSHK